MTEYPKEYIEYLQRLKEGGAILDQVEKLILEKNGKANTNLPERHTQHDGGVN